MLTSFKTVSAYEPFYRLIGRLSPDERAAFLAEHLRGHHSGEGRKGAVQIIEEPDRYRLIFDACGSGGAMRRKAATSPMPGLENYPDASAATWGLAGKVPAFCAHCAQNEIEMIRRYGYPAWVVNFDPDPMKPCGWTVYKNPDLIPEQYFDRVGMKK
jgi:hypothetical protein